MIKAYQIDFEKQHFTSELYHDLEFSNQDEAKKIFPILFTSSEIDLDNSEISFDYLFDHFDGRDYLSSQKSIPVFSEDFIRVIQEFPQECNFFRVNINSTNSHFKSKSYFAVQIPEVSGLVNKEKSRFIKHNLFPDQFSIIMKLELDLSNFDFQIFRIREYPRAIFVQNKLKERVVDAKLAGIKFVPISDFNSFTK